MTKSNKYQYKIIKDEYGSNYAVCKKCYESGTTTPLVTGFNNCDFGETPQIHNYYCPTCNNLIDSENELPLKKD